MSGEEAVTTVIKHAVAAPPGGCGATVRLDSGEPCLLSIAPSSVRVKKFGSEFLDPCSTKRRSHIEPD